MRRYIARESMSKTLIYGAGLIIVFALICTVLFLTFHNILSGNAIIGDENNILIVTGHSAILINFSILGGVISLISYLVFLFSRRIIFQKTYAYLGLFSGILLTIGIVLNAI
jgi:hypothetical protein